MTKNKANLALAVGLFLAALAMLSIFVEGAVSLFGLPTRPYGDEVHGMEIVKMIVSLVAAVVYGVLATALARSEY